MSEEQPTSTAEEPAETRAIRQEVFVEAPPEAVWRALTEADELVRWFPLEARVEPGEGGSVWISWGEGAEGRAAFTAWEPNRHVGWAERYGPILMAVDFHLEARGGGTVVRLVHSGFGTGAEWDDQFHMTEGGWSYFLTGLRLYLERHPGVPRDMVYGRKKTPLTREEAFARLTGPAGLAREGTLRGLGVGERYRVVTAVGDVLEGEVVLADEPVHLAATVDNLSDALLFLEIEPGEDGVTPGLWLSTYGLSGDRVAGLRERFARLYDAALA